MQMTMSANYRRRGVARHSACGIAALLALIVVGTLPANADAMRCTGEKITCVVLCNKMSDRAAASACLTGCGARHTNCMRTGCWNNGVQTYCGLQRQ